MSAPTSRIHQITLCTAESDFEQAFSVIHQLRPHLDYATFRKIVSASKKADDYRIYIALSEQNQILGAMGLRILHDLVRGKHLYIDDLVTDEKARSQGIGAQLLSFAEKLSLELDCGSLRLCTGTENEKGKKFYEREGWTLRSVAYVKKLIR